MANSLQDIFEQQNKKYKELKKSYDSLFIQHADLQAEYKRKTVELQEVHSELVHSRKTITLLQMSNALGSTNEDCSVAQKNITDIVRKIDKCLSLLK